MGAAEATGAAQGAATPRSPRRRALGGLALGCAAALALAALIAGAFTAVPAGLRWWMTERLHPRVSRDQDGDVEIQGATCRSRLVLQARVNGSEPLPFVLDTGASVNVIDETCARSLGLVAMAGARGRVGGPDGTSHGLAEVDSITLEGVRLASHVVALADLTDVSADLTCGILGTPLLRAQPFTLDVGGSRLVLHATAPGHAAGQEVDIDVELGRPVVTARLPNCEPIEVLVDSGAGSTFVWPGCAPDDAMPWQGAPWLGWRQDSTVLWHVPRLAALGVVFTDAHVRSAASRHPADGILGTDLLSRVVVTMDYAQGRAWVVGHDREVDASPREP